MVITILVSVSLLPIVTVDSCASPSTSCYEWLVLSHCVGQAELQFERDGEPLSINQPVFDSSNQWLLRAGYQRWKARLCLGWTGPFRVYYSFFVQVCWMKLYLTVRATSRKQRDHSPVSITNSPKMCTEKPRLVLPLSGWGANTATSPKDPGNAHRKRDPYKQ